MVLAVILALGIGLGAVAGNDASVARVVVGAMGGVIFFVVSMTGRLTALRLIVFFLIVLGFIRRLLIPFAGWSTQDPLLLVAPAAALLIWLNGRRESPKKRDALTILTIFFLFWTIAQILNPNQATILEGAFGAIYWIPPLLWFFVGRTFKISDHKKIITLIIWLAIPVAIHGLRQTYVGLLPFEYTWVGVSGFGAAIFYEGFRIRSFSTLVSPQEYGAFLAFATVMLYGTILARHRYMALRVILMGFLSYALFMQGSRSIFGLFVIACTIMTIVWTRNFGAKLALFGLVAMAIFVIQNAQVPELGDSAAANVVEHQLSGLLDPTNEQDTGGLHLNLILNGFRDSWEKPLGLGTGPSTVVALKKEGRTISTENDVSTIFVALGIPTGVLYVIFMIFVGAAAGRRFGFHRSAYSIASIGVFVAAFGNIWSGGLYAVSSFLWLTIGGLTRPIDEEWRQETEPALQAEGPSETEYQPLAAAV